MTVEVWIRLGKFKDNDSALAYIKANDLKNFEIKKGDYYGN